MWYIVIINNYYYNSSYQQVLDLIEHGNRAIMVLHAQYHGFLHFTLIIGYTSPECDAMCHDI